MKMIHIQPSGRLGLQIRASDQDESPPRARRSQIRPAFLRGARRSQPCVVQSDLKQINYLMMKIKLMFSLLILVSLFNNIISQIPYPGDDPGQARLQTLQGNKVILENKVVSMGFFNNGEKITLQSFEDKKTHEQLKPGNSALFELVMLDSSLITSNDFRLVNSPVASDFPGNPDATTYADRLPGKKYSADLENQEKGLFVHWEADLRDGSNYVRQIFKFKTNNPDRISRIILVKLPANIGLRKEGTVDGSPMVHNNMFFALEYPLSKIEQNEKFMIDYLPRLMTPVSTVWGVTPANQLRRGFLYYVERERTHTYNQVLHYNSWYDISWNDRKFDENECLDRIKVFGDSLVNKRHVKMKAFLFDDGWDDNKTLWQFHSNFPDGFTKLGKAAESYNSGIGVWLSPFGGYGNAKTLRLEYGKIQNPPFETNDQGFSLSGPVYFNRFKEVTANFIRKYGICMFKFDGLGRGSGAGIVYQKDVEAFLKLNNELLEIKPDLYLSLTTGTWPSVYWLKYGDNIWRGGDDTNMMGEGSKRQQWITYRDADTYKNVVKRGPLYPLNSLMLCGICIADNGYPGMFEMNDKDISDEIWSFFATGTNLQELYINPHKLNTANWNCLAEASTWAKENESVMTDVHWVGGDPAIGEVYGFAAWSPEKAVLSLRNPSSVEKIFEINVSRIFEIPHNVRYKYSFYDARTNMANGKKQALAQAKLFRITLQPFEVKVFNAEPQL
jgi:hypothetical protein